MARQFRELDDRIKQKISNSMANKPKSDLHKQRISDGLKKYWERVPNRPTDNKEQNGGGASNGTETQG